MSLSRDEAVGSSLTIRFAGIMATGNPSRRLDIDIMADGEDCGDGRQHHQDHLSTEASREAAAHREAHGVGKGAHASQAAKRGRGKKGEGAVATRNKALDKQIENGDDAEKAAALRAKGSSGQGNYAGQQDIARRIIERLAEGGDAILKELPIDPQSRLWIYKPNAVNAAALTRVWLRLIEGHQERLRQDKLKRDKGEPVMADDDDDEEDDEDQLRPAKMNKIKSTRSRDAAWL